eukprot:SAG31_NODE_2479_length_5631_cov_99.073325_5_plen_46_part_00
MMGMAGPRDAAQQRAGIAASTFTTKFSTRNLLVGGGLAHADICFF